MKKLLLPLFLLFSLPMMADNSYTVNSDGTYNVSLTLASLSHGTDNMRSLEGGFAYESFDDVVLDATLDDKISSVVGRPYDDVKYKIRKLSISGYMNFADCVLMHDMAGTDHLWYTYGTRKDYASSKTDGKLEDLTLDNVTFRSTGGKVMKYISNIVCGNSYVLTIWVGVIAGSNEDVKSMQLSPCYGTRLKRVTILSDGELDASHTLCFADCENLEEVCLLTKDSVSLVSDAFVMINKGVSSYYNVNDANLLRSEIASASVKQMNAKAKIYVPFGQLDATRTLLGSYDCENASSPVETSLVLPYFRRQDGEWQTFCSHRETDFSSIRAVNKGDASGMKAYAVTGYDAATQQMQWLEVDNRVAAGEGLLLHVTDDDFYLVGIPAGISNPSRIEGNRLVGVTKKSFINGAAQRCYFCLRDESFDKMESGQDLMPYTAYLNFDNVNGVSLSTWNIPVVGRVEGKTSAVVSPFADKFASPNLYSLDGKPFVGEPKSGIYVRGGRKYVVK